MTIVITSKHDGFRRCGIAHSSSAARYPDDFFSEAQLRALSKEPQLILAYEEDEFDQVKDRRDENLQEVDVSKASGAAQNDQSQTLEASATALGDGVVLPVAPVAGNLDSLWDDALLEDEQREAAKLNAETETLWDEAIAEDVLREAAKVKAAKAPAKPKKAADK
ncbi:HI1506-related protein [Pseudomonas sp. KT_2_4]|uniref:HI1506-related protein n=1 Tax=Pseudomonas sp. KT_2_4 TaxID=3241600 RepID=UPI00352B5601